MRALLSLKNTPGFRRSEKSVRFLPSTLIKPIGAITRAQYIEGTSFSCNSTLSKRFASPVKDFANPLLRSASLGLRRDNLRKCLRAALTFLNSNNPINMRWLYLRKSGQRRPLIYLL